MAGRGGQFSRLLITAGAVGAPGVLPSGLRRRGSDAAADVLAPDTVARGCVITQTSAARGWPKSER